jgi:hypothetical protein
MKKVLLTFAMVGLSVLCSSLAAASEDAQLIAKLKDAKFSLMDAIRYAEKNSGPATSAKFEMDGDKLVFSVYTAPQGLEALPEATDLTEISGSATTTAVEGQAEIFTDKEHIARASSHLTLMQLSNMTLTEVIAKALRIQPGIAFSVKNPQVRNHRAVADVSIVDQDGDVEVVTIDLMK